MAYSFPSSTIYLKISIIPTCLGLLLYILGFSTPYWEEYTREGFNFFADLQLKYIEHVGIWGRRSCALLPGLVENCEYSKEPITSEDWLLMTRIFCLLALLSAITTVILICFCLFSRPVAQTTAAHVSTLVMCLTTAGFILISLVIFGAKHDERKSEDIIGVNPASIKLSWSFVVNAISCVLFSLSTLLVFLNLVKKRSSF